MGNWLLRSAGSSRDRLWSNISFEHFEAVISKLPRILTKQQDHVRRAHSPERGAGARGTHTDTHRHIPSLWKQGWRQQDSEGSLRFATQRAPSCSVLALKLPPQHSQSCFPPFLSPFRSFLGPTSCTATRSVLSLPAPGDEQAELS